MEHYFGEATPKLGFGLMRLPKKATGKIDLEQTKKMVDMFMDAGLNYFDTAYVYDGGDSERAAKEALVDRYPRESYTLATKLCAWMGAYNENTAKQQFYTSLERTGAGYFDYYLLHALQEGNYKKYDEYHIWDFVKEQKEKGLIKHWGFSFHATPDILDEILTSHPDTEFVQLQLNYADWENPDVTARENYEVARKHGKSIIVMEPVKGGALANPPETVRKIFKEVNPDVSYASWAIRYAASLEGIITVLSGMSNVAQMEDNLSYMKDFKLLNRQEQTAVRKAQEAINGIKSIPCTACHYCTTGCPKKIPIPEIFEARNKQLIWGQLEEGKAAYEQATADAGTASNCIACGQCERACPQQIKVIERLKDCADSLENRKKEI
ncbi:MAG: 4Fe-4S dicluster domain-containing protein [Lachnospiraceae bacterium]|nr:4Fe-4S dicluster domain-containing protein [Lachnospiraceae bacterium]